MFVLYPMARLVFSSMALTFLTNMNEKYKCASPSAIQVQNRITTVGIEEKLSVMTRREEGERIVDICRNLTLARDIVHKIRDNADRIKESAQSGNKVFV
jgi:hypothetical protein